MKNRIVNWVATIFLVALVLQGTNPVNGKKKEKHEKSKRTLDLGSGKELSEDLNSYDGENVGCRYARGFFKYRSSRGVITNFLGNTVDYVLGRNGSMQQEFQCGDYFARQCQYSRYRSMDGSCNNLKSPTWGMANTRYARILPPAYADGLNMPTKSITGNDLPLSRLLSYTLTPNLDIDDPIWTLVAMQWGQVMTHDMGMIDGPTQSTRHITRCCTDDGQLIKSLLLFGQCYPIIIPHNDPIYGRTNTRCLNFIRSFTDLDRGCKALFQPAEQLNVVTHYLDLSLVYGSSDQMSSILRAGVRGRLNVEVRGNRQWPPSFSNKSLLCESKRHEPCYETGDTRGNQNTELTVLQIILLREHNRIADALAQINPHWTDETIFQEARRIAIAEHQHISYYEWLPIFLGKRNTYGAAILYNTTGYVNDYDPSVNPSTLNEHSTVAFRYFHTLIAGNLHLVDEYRRIQGALRLSDHFNKPGVIEQGDNLNNLIRGMTFQHQKESDKYLDPEITHYLFRGHKQFGSDLRARDIQRNRDHGLASYNSYREYCGLPRARYFSDFADYISPEDIAQLSRLYESPDDIDLTVGGVLERHVPGALAGPTLLCILTKQFHRTRVGDRFWYERGDHDAAFTIEQLTEIRKASIARLLCDNGDSITHMQREAFEKVSKRNPLVHCQQIPSVNLLLWKDYSGTPIHGGTQQLLIL